MQLCLAAVASGSRSMFPACTHAVIGVIGVCLLAWDVYVLPPCTGSMHLPGATAPMDEHHATGAACVPRCENEGAARVRPGSPPA